MSVSAADIQTLATQLGREPRGVIEIAARADDGEPLVVATAPRLEDGTPFPTTFYLTQPQLVKACSTLEAEHVMETMQNALGDDEALASGYQQAHEAYIAARTQLGEVPEIAGVSAGGMPNRVKCLHALVGHALAAGPGVNPVGDWALALIRERGLAQVPHAFAAIDVPASPSVDRISALPDRAGAPETAQVVAGIDCGTNSIRLLIARREGAKLHDLHREMRVVRLGQDVDKTGRLAPEALERTFQALDDYAALIRQAGAQAVSFVATSATRDAENAAEFAAGVQARLGVSPQVVSGAREAELSFQGALSGMSQQLSGPYLVVDIGGGSTEFAFGAEKVEASLSVDMGCVRITERFLKDGKVAEAESYVSDLIDRAQQVIDFSQVQTLVGLAGSVTTITAAALGLTEYDPRRIHGTILPPQQILAACTQLRNASDEEKEQMSFMHPGRRDVIAAGALIWSLIVQRVRNARHATLPEVENQRQEKPAAATAGSKELIIVTSEHDILDGITLDA